jgi:hypothetical protein
VNWQPHAQRLATEVTHPASRWRTVVEAVPRHVFVPRWWTSRSADPDGWATWDLSDGPADEHGWLESSYANRSLVTRIGPLHADHASPGDHPAGLPTSSSTLPGLIVQLARHAYLNDGVDVEEYLTKSAAARLGSLGLHPAVVTADARDLRPDHRHRRGPPGPGKAG